MDDEEESHYFEESEYESQFADDDGANTLEGGKNSSKQKKSKRKQKQEKRAKKAIKTDGKGGGVCGGPNDKACCTIF